MTTVLKNQSKQLLTAKTLTLHWHDNSLPVYSVDFQPNREGTRSERLATGGGDGNIRIWKVIYTNNDPINGQSVESVEYLSNIGKHTQAVNCVRFDPSGQFLASASDDGSVMIWELSDKLVQEFGANDEFLKESWSLKTAAFSPSSSEIYDISWSPDSKFIVCGSMDNFVRVFDTKTGMVVSQIRDHTHYVQGVQWDPRNEFICSQSADRSVHVYNILSSKKDHDFIEVALKASINIYRAKVDFNVSCPTSMSTSSSQNDNSSEKPRRYLYKNETLQSFFRRLAISPDGSLLISPCGLYKSSETSENENAVFIHIRAGLRRPPVMCISGFKKPAIAVRFSPVLFKLQEGESGYIDLPYRMIFAIATQDSIFVYDTQRLEPLAVAASIHYAVITDICWSADGKVLMASSADGFVSSIVFDDDLIGKDIVTYDIPSYVSSHPIESNEIEIEKTEVGDHLNTSEKKLEERHDGSPSLNIIDASSTVSLSPSIVEMLKISSESRDKASIKSHEVLKKPSAISSDDDEVVELGVQKAHNERTKSGIDCILHKAKGLNGDRKESNAVFACTAMSKSGMEKHKRRRIAPTLISTLTRDK